ncbi:MAG: hypothetical protein HY721_17130 [Planctomycetes bacterium]|nr:hypothetical protein [Planctomycetota bacterium]
MRRTSPARVAGAVRSLSPAPAIPGLVATLVAACLAAAGCGVLVSPEGGRPERVLKAITINTQAYTVAPGAVDRRSASLVAPEDMRIAAIEHFTGVQKGGWSDNGHILSLRPENPWSEWQAAGTGMEPTGATGYFGYCGRDYYTEVGGIGDVTSYEALPAGTHVLVPRGAALYQHTYASNFLSTPQAFHHAVRLLYW